ncbi:MAG: putative sugar nucleotidyl transferase [Planctomycetota bacterium]
MRVICFEDETVAQMAPITLSRPAYAIRCAGYCLMDWLRELAKRQSGLVINADVRPHLVAIQQADIGLESPPDELQSDGSSKDGLLIVSARIAPSVSNYETLCKLVSANEISLARDEESDVIAAWLPEGAAVNGDYQTQWSYAIARGHDSTSTLTAWHWPHDVVATHMKCMDDSVAYRIQHGDYQQREDGVFVQPGVTIGAYASIDVNHGPIVLDEDVSIGPFCFLEGPLYAGHDTRVLEHSAIKDGVALGHTTKIGGEVEASMIEPYTNKQHHGFLGHSYLGSWINLGAGTCNSDLKNTYGQINMTYGEQKIATGMQFLGCIMGDYSKSAINTGIFTGKVIGVCSMMYGFVTANVPSYVNYARLFGQTSLLPPDVMVNTQARMFSRRNVTQRQCDIDLIHDMYRMTESERQSGDL